MPKNFHVQHEGLEDQWNRIVITQSFSDVPFNYQLRKHKIEHELLKRLY